MFETFYNKLCHLYGFIYKSKYLKNLLNIFKTQISQAA
jgi:hypothetical protein